MWRLSDACNEDMGLGIDPMRPLGVPLLFNGAQAVCQFLLAEQLITGPFALLQLLPALVEGHAGIAPHRMRAQRVKSGLRAHGEHVGKGGEAALLTGSPPRQKSEGDAAAAVCAGR